MIEQGWDGIWTFDSHLNIAKTDIVGFSVHTRDGRLGPARHVGTGDDGQYLIVAAGRWPFRTLRMIPGGLIAYIDPRQRRAYLNANGAEVDRSPAWHERRRDRGDWRQPYTDHFMRHR